jgi:hypothetical protein
LNGLLQKYMFFYQKMTVRGIGSSFRLVVTIPDYQAALTPSDQKILLAFPALPRRIKFGEPA